MLDTVDAWIMERVKEGGPCAGFLYFEELTRLARLYQDRVANLGVEISFADAVRRLHVIAREIGIRTDGALA